MKSAEKIEKLAADRGTSKPCSIYTSRARSKAAKKRFAVTKSPGGRKPRYSIALSRNASFAVLREYQAIATLAQIYQDAYEKKNLALCVQMYETERDRVFGKAFTATNPADTDKINAIFNDNRLQIGIQQLLPATHGDKQTTAKLQAPSIDNDIIESTG